MLSVPPQASSLRAQLYPLADALGMTPAAVYERQRELVRCDLLERKDGKGRGSGTPLSARSLATLLTGTLSTEKLSEVATETPRILKAEALDNKCPLTGAKTFEDALAIVLGGAGLYSRVLRVIVTQGVSAIIEFDFTGETTTQSVFTADRFANRPKRCLAISVNGETLAEIAELLGE